MNNKMTQALAYAVENNMLTMTQAFEVVRGVEDEDTVNDIKQLIRKLLIHNNNTNTSNTIPVIQ